MSIFFFFQAEDGIRDIGVTGVQTCALPISSSTLSSEMFSRSGSSSLRAWTKTGPTATPSDAATPAILPLTSASTWHPSSLVLVLADQLHQGLHGLFGVLSLGPDDYLITLFGR